MSKATVTGQITVTSNGTTLHTILQCTTGDVYQNYDGDPASPSNVVPNFEASGATKPKLVMQDMQKGAFFNFEVSWLCSKRKEPERWSVIRIIVF